VPASRERKSHHEGVHFRPELEIMNAGERRLISLAAALIGNSSTLARAERELVASAHSVDAKVIAEARSQTRAGHDLLGTGFCRLRSARERRQHGATYTPAPIVGAMIEC
jgi:hypothetical protein